VASESDSPLVGSEDVMGLPSGPGLREGSGGRNGVMRSQRVPRS